MTKINKSAEDLLIIANQELSYQKEENEKLVAK